MTHAHSDDTTPVEHMDLVGGELCLDLVNTGSHRRIGPFREKLNSYDDLVTWAERIGLVGAARGAKLRRVAERSPAEAERVLARAHALRETIYRVFSPGTAEAERIADLAQLGRAAAEAAAERRLEATSSGFTWTWPDDDRLEQLLWPVALSAAELLTSDDLPRVKECAADDCSWLFLDLSRNLSRRWCDMKSCGNRAKARRHYARREAQA